MSFAVSGINSATAFVAKSAFLGALDHAAAEPRWGAAAITQILRSKVTKGREEISREEVQNLLNHGTCPCNLDLWSWHNGKVNVQAAARGLMTAANQGYYPDTGITKEQALSVGLPV